MVTLDELLRYLADQRGSDLHLKPGSAPRIRVDGQLRSTPFDLPTPAEVEATAREVLPAERWEELDAVGSIEVGVSIRGLGRFRAHVHRQRGSVALTVRRIPPGNVGLAELGLPAQVGRFADEERGLLLVSGGSGSGRTTTIAALVDRINERRPCHILTVESPIEVLHTDKEAIVTQREVGTDTPSYAAALRGATRADADVVVVGAITSAETAAEALAVADAGRLVIASVRASGAPDTVDRFVGLFPVDRQNQVRQALGSSLLGVVNQRLLERADGAGRVVAAEVLVATHRVVDCIVDPAAHSELDRLIADGQYHGMQSLDDALFELARSGAISRHDALVAGGSSEDLRIRLDQLIAVR